MARPSIALSAACCILASLGCVKTDNVTDNDHRQDTSKQYTDNPLAPISPAKPKTSIYRYLSGLENAYPNNEMLADLCIRKHGFYSDLPTQSVKSARDIRLPVTKKWTEIGNVRTTRYRTVMVQPREINGIIMKPDEVREPYVVIEERTIAKRISGMCIGSEYILG
jgi:hypothetical protein